MPTALKDLLPGLFKSQDNWRLALLQNWPAIVGGLQTRIRLEKIYDDTIVIGVYESHWMQELYLLSSLLLDKINAHLKEKPLAHIRFKLVEEKKRLQPKQHSLLKNKSTITLKFTTQQEKALAALPDEQLKNSLIQFWQRCQLLEESRNETP